MFGHVKLDFIVMYKVSFSYHMPNRFRVALYFVHSCYSELVFYVNYGMLLQQPYNRSLKDVCVP